MLPESAREQLKKAANTPIPANDPLARVKAIEAAMERIRRDYPDHFKTEPEPTTTE